MVTPRRVILSVGCNSLFIKWSGGWFWLLFLLMIISSVLLALNVTHQLSAHSSILFKSHWRLSAHTILSHVFLMAIWSVESANKWMSFSRCEAKSSINIRKSIQPRILPWRTPAHIGFADDVEPSSTTDCCLSDRKNAMQVSLDAKRWEFLHETFMPHTVECLLDVKGND